MHPLPSPPLSSHAPQETPPRDPHVLQRCYNRVWERDADSSLFPPQHRGDRWMTAGATSDRTRCEASSSPRLPSNRVLQLLQLQVQRARFPPAGETLTPGTSQVLPGTHHQDTRKSSFTMKRDLQLWTKALPTWHTDVEISAKSKQDFCLRHNGGSVCLHAAHGDAAAAAAAAAAAGWQVTDWLTDSHWLPLRRPAAHCPLAVTPSDCRPAELIAEIRYYTLLVIIRFYSRVIA